MRDNEILELGRQVAAYLDGWSYQPGDEEHNTEHRAYFVKDGMRFSIARDWRKKDRVDIGTWSWPVYSEFARGESSTKTVTPRDLYNPSESVSDISVSLARGPETIAREIKRRFLPEYERVYRRCQEKAITCQQYEDRARDGWEQVCAAIGKTPTHDLHYVDTASESMHVTLRRSGDKAKVEFSANADQVLAVLKALGTPFRTE